MTRKSKKAIKTITVILIVAAIFFTIIIVPLTIAKTVNSSFMLSMHTDSAPKLIAHRGLSVLYPENTLPAFKGADEYGFYGYEFDIQTTKDGQWVAIHDDIVDNMTDGTGEIEHLTLEEISEFNIDSGSNIESQEMKNLELKIPTLRQSLDVCSGSDIVPVIEIKKCDIKHLSSLKEILDEYSLSDKAVIISFEEEYLEEYRKLDSNIEILYLSTSLTKEDIDWCAENNFGVNFNCWLFFRSYKAVRYAKEKGLTLAAWTVNVPIVADVMVLFGAEYITTKKLLP